MAIIEIDIFKTETKSCNIKMTCFWLIALCFTPYRQYSSHVVYKCKACICNSVFYNTMVFLRSRKVVERGENSRKISKEIPRFKRCLHHKKKSRRSQQTFFFPRSRISYSGFSRGEEDIEWCWKSFEKESWRWFFFSLSKKYFSFVKSISLLFPWSWLSGMTMHVFFISCRAGHNRFMVSRTILHSSRHCPYNLVGQDSFSRTSGPLFCSKYTPLSLQLL